MCTQQPQQLWVYRADCVGVILIDNELISNARRAQMCRKCNISFQSVWPLLKQNSFLVKASVALSCAQQLQTAQKGSLHTHTSSRVVNRKIYEHVTIDNLFH